MSEIFLVRHAQASFGTDNYDELSDIGWQQSRLLGEYFFSRNGEFDRIISGTLNRHKETLEGMLECFPDNVVWDENEDLNEYHFSELYIAYEQCYPEDEDIITCRASDHKDARAFYRVVRSALLAWSNNEFDSLVTESWHDFLLRTEKNLNDICKSVSSGENILILSSGGVISMMLKHILELSAHQAIGLNMQIRNSSISHCYYSNGDLSFAGFNGLPHLDTLENRHLITLS